MSGRAARDKGLRRERQIVALHEEAGVKAERVPLSGASHFQGTAGDVEVHVFGQAQKPLIAEVKGRGQGQGFVTIARWLGENDMLFLIQDREAPLVVLPWPIYARLLQHR